MLILGLGSVQGSKWGYFLGFLFASFEKIRLFSGRLRHAISNGESIYVKGFSCCTLECYC